MGRNKQIFCPHCQSDDIFSRGETCICGNCGSRFQIPSEEREEKPFQPLNLFLSYSHKEAKICRLINQALKDRGHTTWFDEEKLHQGQDWRQKIAEGIKESGGVISCLSNHAVRQVPPPPGVCLDELSIAIGVQGGNIKTILLEPEKDVHPPASLCHIQWLDMSDWKNWEAKGEDIFRPWFNAKMKQLFQVIESDENMEFVGQISAIQEKLHINYSISKQRDLLQHLFVGREWLTEQLEQWLDDPEGARLCVLYGDPGVGKSAFAANYIHYNPRVAAGVFCEYGHTVYNDTKNVIMTLAYLLACRLPDYRTALDAVLEREKQFGGMNESELFDMLLANPLALTIDGGHETLCIVIDGLDECAQGEFNALAEVLARHVPRLPTWLRVLVTSREVAAVKAPLTGTFALELHGDRSQNQADIRRYFVKRLEESQGGDPAWEYALDALTERSGGIFLYAQLVCDGILAGKISIHDVDSFPDGLSKAFYQWFCWLFPDDREYKADFRLPLGMLVVAPEPLPTEELKRIFEWDNNQLGDFLRRIKVLLRQDVNDFDMKTITFTHLYLNKWLGTEQAGCFQSDRAAALERMAGRFYALFKKDVKSLTEYESLHLATLLEQSGNTTALAEVTLDHNLFWNIICAGNYCKTWGKISVALVCYNQASAMAEQLVQKRGTPEDRRDLGVSYDKIADILRSKGDLDGALELFQKNQKIVAQLVREQNTTEDRRNLGDSYDKIANILQSKGDLGGALKLHQKGMEIVKQLVRERNALEDCRAMSVGYDRIAGILQTNGDLDEALKYCQASIEIAEQVVQKRNTPENCWTLWLGYYRIAGILRIKGNLDKALELYRKSVDILKKPLREWGTPEVYRSVSVSFICIADILRVKGDLNEALMIYQWNIKTVELLVQKRGTLEDRKDLSVSYHRMADILRDRGDLDGALELYQKSMEIMEQLVQERGTPKDREDLSVSYHKTADTLQDKGDLDGALGLYQKSMKIDEQLVLERDTPDDRWSLNVCYVCIADILRAKNDLDRALELYQKGVKAAEQLVRERGTTNDFEGLITFYYNLANLPVLPNVKRFDYAKQGLELSIQLFEATGLDIHRDFCEGFKRLLIVLISKTLDQHNE